MEFLESLRLRQRKLAREAGVFVGGTGVNPWRGSRSGFEALGMKARRGSRSRAQRGEVTEPSVSAETERALGGEGLVARSVVIDPVLNE